MNLSCWLDQLVQLCFLPINETGHLSDGLSPTGVFNARIAETAI